MDNSSLTVGDVKELKKQIKSIRRKQELVFDALKCKILSIETDIAQEQCFLVVNPNLSDRIIQLKIKSIQENQKLLDEYKELSKEFKQDERR